jgi:hypothetical protein
MNLVFGSEAALLGFWEFSLECGPVRLDSSELIPGILKRLQIWALSRQAT